jgi:hypothetical protein
MAPQSTWQQANSNGFGTANATEVGALSAFDGYLYAGTYNVTDRALILRSPDGVAWSAVIDPGFGISHDIAPPAILSMTVFNARVYAGTGRGDGPGQIYRSLNGINWAPMVIDGFADQDNVDITAFGSFNGMIYAGVTNLTSGAQIWRSYTGDNNSWTKVAPTTPGTDAAAVTAFAAFDGAFYAAVESNAPAQIWRSYGASWTTIVGDGFGDSNTTQTGGMAVFGGYLYVGAGNGNDGGQLWRTNDGANWAQVITPGFGDANNTKVESLFVFQNELYATTQNTSTGMEVWRTADGAVWDQANADGFGDANNSGTNWSNATTPFLGRLYLGTSNSVTGGELWRMTPAAFYDVALSPDDARAGLPGETVTYTLTITNSGTVSDTYDLAASGNAWPTSLSTASIQLNAGASTPFNAYVTVPPGAMPADSDTASVTATSQGDTAKSATAHLTTTVMPAYGVLLSPGTSLAGLPGQTVTYTVAMTNTGLLADTYDLTTTGNAWVTALSSSTMALAPGAAGTFTAAVTIPGNATGGAFDSVTVTATSQGDNTVSDSAILTTSCIGSGHELHLPLLLRLP